MVLYMLGVIWLSYIAQCNYFQKEDDIEVAQAVFLWPVWMFFLLITGFLLTPMYLGMVIKHGTDTLLSWYSTVKKY